jgi:hypothetical protein
VAKPRATDTPAKRHDAGAEAEASGLSSLQQQVGNQAVQRLLAQRRDTGPAKLDEETADRVNRERSGGEALDGAVQAQMNASLGQDFSNVRVHNSSESDALNQQLGAKAFTTGPDIFFREGAYEPHTSQGQELIAHELTHVVQQNSGRVGSGSGMTVNAPDDTFEQEADALSKAVTGSESPAAVQRQAEEGLLQKQDMPEEQEEAEEAAETEVSTEELPDEEMV